MFRRFSSNNALPHSTRQVMKTYHMYNADSINAESKLKEAEKQEEKQMGRGARQDERQTPRSPDTLSSVRLDDKPVRRSSVKKIEKMKEKVSPLWGEGEDEGCILEFGGHLKWERQRSAEGAECKPSFSRWF